MVDSSYKSSPRGIAAFLANNQNVSTEETTGRLTGRSGFNFEATEQNLYCYLMNAQPNKDKLKVREHLHRFLKAENHLGEENKVTYTEFAKMIVQQSKNKKANDTVSPLRSNRNRALQKKKMLQYNYKTLQQGL